MGFLDATGITRLVTDLKNKFVSKTNFEQLQAQVETKQNELISGTNIKTVNNTSLLGSGNVTVQPTLISGTNIKTINNNSLLGSGNLTIESGSSSKIYIGTSNTAASTAIKDVTCEGFTLKAGAVISVKFQYGNSASLPELNVNGTGGRYISEYGAGRYIWREYSTLTFFYDGTNYIVVSRDESQADVYSVLCTTSASIASKDISAKYITFNKICLLAVTFTSGSASNTMSLNIGNGNSREVYKGNKAVSASNPLKLAPYETAVFTPYSGGYILVAKTNGYLPTVTSTDNGKVLMVVNGEWSAASLPVYNGGVS